MGQIDWHVQQNFHTLRLNKLRPNMKRGSVINFQIISSEGPTTK